MPEGETATRIAAAARDILVGEGAEAVSMRRVAKAVGITPMAIYWHFPDRATLLRAVAVDAYQELAGSWGRRSVSDDWDGHMAGLLDDFLDFALGSPNLYTFLITDRWEQARRFPEDFRAGEGPPFSIVAAAIERGMSEGLLREDDPLEAALVLTASVQGLVQLYHAGRIGLPEPEFRQLCTRSLWRVLDGLKV